MKLPRAIFTLFWALVIELLLSGVVQAQQAPQPEWIHIKPLGSNGWVEVDFTSNIATGTNSTAYGTANIASGFNSTALGITNTASGTVTYARTSGMTKMTVARGVSSSVTFAVPAGTPAGPSTLVVVANGLASAPVSVTVSG